MQCAFQEICLHFGFGFLPDSIIHLSLMCVSIVYYISFVYSFPLGFDYAISFHFIMPNMSDSVCCFNGIQAE